MIVITIIGWISGCSTASTLHVVDKKQPPPKYQAVQPDRYTVRRGDTLYSIAWRHDVTVRELKHYNSFSGSDLIFPGQTLYTRRSKAWLAERPLPAVTTVSKTKEPKRSAPQLVVKNPPKVKNAPAAAKSIDRSKKRSPIAPKKNSSSKRTQVAGWIWPTKGKIVHTSGSGTGLSRGVDIHGELGDSIHAASAGTVVYSGTGLKDYGKLLIIKHSERYLTAYAHNQSLLVREGDKVKQGQVIATMGSTGTNQVKLHFEIRDNGKSIDPKRLIK